MGGVGWLAGWTWGGAQGGTREDAGGCPRTTLLKAPVSVHTSIFSGCFQLLIFFDLVYSSRMIGVTVPILQMGNWRPNSVK